MIEEYYKWQLECLPLLKYFWCHHKIYLFFFLPSPGVPPSWTLSQTPHEYFIGGNKGQVGQRKNPIHPVVGSGTVAQIQPKFNHLHEET